MAQCHYCREPAEYLCDAPCEGGPPRITGEQGVTTCSRPICKIHRVVRGGGIVTFARRGGGRRCERFTIDWCPDCAKENPMNNHYSVPGGYQGGYSELDQFGEQAQPVASFRPGLETVPNGDYDCQFDDAELDRVNSGTVVRVNLKLLSAGSRSVEHTYWLNNQQSVNRFLAEMVQLGFPAQQWGAGPGKLPLSQAIPACVARLKGLRFRATKSSRHVPAKPGQFGQPGREAATYHDLHISGPISGTPMPGPAQPPVPSQQPILTGTSPGGYASDDIPF